MADENRIPPIPIPAGSFDVLELRKNLDSAVSVKNRETHPERIAEAIVKSADDVTKEVLANGGKDAIPEHARRTTQKVDGEDVEVVSFKPAEDAKTGKEAAEMSYPANEADDPKTEEVEQPATIETIAAEVVGDAKDTSGKN